MKIRQTSFIAKFVTLFVLVGINLFGLHNFSSDRLWGPLNTYDVFIIVLNGLFIRYFFKTELANQIKKNPHLKYFFTLYIFIIFIIVTMPLRGPISIIDAGRVARDYLVIPLAFLIFYDISKKNTSDLYLKLFLFIAVFTAIQIIINAFSPDFIRSIFPELEAQESMKFEFQRNYLLSASMIFPHIACIFSFSRINSGHRGKATLAVFAVTFLGSALQGFRIYFIVLVILIFAIWAKKISLRSLIKGLIGMVVLGLSFFLMDKYYFNSQIIGKIDTAFLEISGERTGTLERRYLRDRIFMYPKFFEKPLQGWGFIYYGSAYGRELGIERSINDRRYTLYSIDSGYLTLLIQFGIVGCIFLALIIFKILRGLYGKSSIINESTFFIWWLLVFSLATHGAFFNVHGLIPLSIFMGLTAGYGKSDRQDLWGRSMGNCLALSGGSPR